MSSPRTPRLRAAVSLGLLAGAAVLATAPGCGQLPAISADDPAEVGLWRDSPGSVYHDGLADLADDFWELQLRAYPTQATRLGDPRFHGRLRDLGVPSLDAERQELEDLRARALAIPAGTLIEQDRVTLELLKFEISGWLDRHRMRPWEWEIDVRSGPHLAWLSLAEDQPVDSDRERDQLLDRWGAMGGYLRALDYHLDQGRRKGKVATYTALTKVIAQIDAVLATNPFDSPLLEPALGGGRWVELPPGGSVARIAHRELGDGRKQSELRLVNRHLQEGRRLAVGTRVLIPHPDDPLSPADRGEFLADVLDLIETQIYPALAAHGEFLERELLPRARTDSEPGITHLPGGNADYARLAAYHTTTDLTPAQIHAIGLEEVARVRHEIADLGERVFGTRDFEEIQHRLRTDPEMHFATREEVERYAREAVLRAERAVGGWFGELPGADCAVVAVPAHEEKDTTIAYYRRPSADGERPGRYFINTYEPQTRPRYEAAALAFHEAVPGHHLQIALAQELSGLPRIRRHGGHTAFIEGWALYAERLADEMGLYADDVDRLGMLSFDAWRAGRLVVDTGIHELGWSREEAIDYLYDNTLLARNNVVNEVDRYIGWPGQALAYKIGQLEILALRAEAEEALGARFVPANFHDVVLSAGSVTLPILRRRVHDWIDEERGR